MSQFESWDPKSDLETGGPFKAIPTTVPGVHISELLPHTARQMHHMALIRSVSTDLDDHGLANNLVRSGRMTRSATEFPELGAVVAKGLERPDFPLPGHIATMVGAREGEPTTPRTWGPGMRASRWERKREASSTRSCPRECRSPWTAAATIGDAS